MELNPTQMDVLRELVNIGIGKAAARLNAMVKSHVHLHVPTITIVPASGIQEALSEFFQEKVSAVRMSFSGGLHGLTSLYFPPESAAKLVNVLVGEESTEGLGLDSMRIGALTEVGNVLLNGVLGSISNALGERLEFTVPSYGEETIGGLVASGVIDPKDVVMVAEAEFTVEELRIKGAILLFLEVRSFDDLVGAIDRLLAGKS